MKPCFKPCFCGCGAKLEFTYSPKPNDYKCEVELYDWIRVCTNRIKGQIIPQLHLQFEAIEQITGNSAKIYNRYGDVIYDNDLVSPYCPCMGKRSPL